MQNIFWTSIEQMYLAFKTNAKEKTILLQYIFRSFEIFFFYRSKNEMTCEILHLS